ncbi:hypothetical protein [Escherichia coli]|uniref:hypothetical protein n=1 Tax=Escherichia coli TaxID=562 RepID=UPI000AFAA7DB|nr:hypothetical protein [Escherichia coli]
MERMFFHRQRICFIPCPAPVYEAAGRWPEDGIVVDYVVYKVFAAMLHRQV